MRTGRMPRRPIPSYAPVSVTTAVAVTDTIRNSSTTTNANSSPSLLSLRVARPTPPSTTSTTAGTTTTTISDHAMTALTPMQRSMRQARRRRRWTSIRFLTMIAAIMAPVGMIVVVNVGGPLSVSTSRSATSLSSISSSSGFSHLILTWDEDDEGELEEDAAAVVVVDDDEQEDSTSETYVKMQHRVSSNISPPSYIKDSYPWTLFRSIFNGKSNRQSNDNNNSNNNNTQPSQQQRHKTSDDDYNEDDTAIGEDGNIQFGEKKTALNYRLHAAINNPSVYGWTPTLYPNPIDDPVRCAVAYILPHLTSATPNDSTSNATTAKTATADDSTIVNPLRLCDPDWVLGGVYLEEVAASMFNFSQSFGPNRRHNVEQDEDRNGYINDNNEDWNVEVGPSDRRQLRTPDNTFDVLHTPSKAYNFERNGNVQIDEGMKNGFEVRTSRQLRPMPETRSSIDSHRVVPPTIDLAIATVRKINLAAVLRQSSYYSSYEDEDDMVNDAAQIFARILHDSWWNNTGSGDSGNNNNNNAADHGILLFLSVQDRVCFISTGSAIASILPWWRLDHIVASMKPDLRHRDYGNALLRAVADLSHMLEVGPPTLSDRLHDFVSRFGLVIAFAAFTVIFGAWGEYRDRRKRWHYAEQRSKLTGVDRQKAQKLQQEFCTRCCPICLESFDYGCGHSDVNQERSSLRMEEIASHETEEVSATEKTLLFLPRSITWNVAVDDFGIPRRGADGKKLKMLRCGHIFCETCWKSWVHSSACGSPCQCPVCRQDVGVSCRSRRSSPTVSSPTASLDNVLPTSESTEGRLLVSGVSRPVYDSITESSAPRPENGNIRNFRVSAMLRGSVLFCQPHFTRRADSLGSTVSPTNETIPLLVRPQSCNFESYI